MTPTRSVTLTSSQRLRVFLIASFCLHVGSLWPLLVKPQPLAGARETILPVNLVSTEPAPPVARSAGTPQLSTPHRVSAPIASVTAQLPPSAPPTEPEDVALTATNADGNGPGMSREAVLASIQALILNDLRRYFDYPSIARRHGWQGTVWLAFTVEANGAVDRIHVANSSGYDILDHSAMVAMRRVGRLPETNRWLGGRALEMRVPVIYRLIDR